ncbi:outer membrane lipoprotein carrier protein LolA [Pollutibacter soli]|uniref:LolA family protein n=1 Tax=Pollutibacter soli TaxID=3034157 RepID=UPI0030141748
MKKIPILSFILLLISSLSFAQTPKGMGKSDPEAKKILDEVSTKFKSYKTVKANFALKIENAAGKTQGSKSGVLQMKGMKYKVDITGQEIFCDSKNVWTLDKSANEVQVSKLDESAGNITPQKLFSNFYDNDFLYVTNDDVKRGNKVYQVVELTPIDKTKPFFKVLVEVDKATKTIMSTRVFEKNGNRYIYTINSLSTNAPIADETFVFDAKKFPGVEVIDLR